MLLQYFNSPPLAHGTKKHFQDSPVDKCCMRRSRKVPVSFHAVCLMRFFSVEGLELKERKVTTMLCAQFFISHSCVLEKDEKLLRWEGSCETWSLMKCNFSIFEGTTRSVWGWGRAFQMKTPRKVSQKPRLHGTYNSSCMFRLAIIGIKVKQTLVLFQPSRKNKLLSSSFPIWREEWNWKKSSRAWYRVEF